MFGLYILHPNNLEQWGHIANASFAVKREERAKGIGKQLVIDWLMRAGKNGFRGLQFNVGVATNLRPSTCI